MYDEPIVQELTIFLQGKLRELHERIALTERLAGILRADPPPYVLCHGDMHGWNLLINIANRQGDWVTQVQLAGSARLSAASNRCRPLLLRCAGGRAVVYWHRVPLIVTVGLLDYTRQLHRGSPTTHSVKEIR